MIIDAADSGDVVVVAVAATAVSLVIVVGDGAVDLVHYAAS